MRENLTSNSFSNLSPSCHHSRNIIQQLFVNKATYGCYFCSGVLYTHVECNVTKFKFKFSIPILIFECFSQANKWKTRRFFFILHQYTRNFVSHLSQHNMLLLYSVNKCKKHFTVKKIFIFHSCDRFTLSIYLFSWNLYTFLIYIFANDIFYSIKPWFSFIYMCFLRLCVLIDWQKICKNLHL